MTRVLARTLALVAFQTVVVVSASGCGDNQDPAGAEALFKRIQDLNYRSTFARAPGYETRLPSNTQHSDFSEVFINDVVDEAITDAEPLSEWPIDSLIIKDGTDDDGTLELIAVMEKRSDGWYWAEYLEPDAPDGGPKFSGKPAVCIDCHQGAATVGNDFTQVLNLPK